jgi:hypothetical protein
MKLLGMGRMLVCVGSLDRGGADEQTDVLGGTIHAYMATLAELYGILDTTPPAAPGA